MNKCEKLLKPLLLILGILCVCLAFAGCGQSDEEWDHSAGSWKETDGVYFGLICKDDAPEGEIKADKVDADLTIRLDREYYYIIDFVLQAAENNSGFEELTVSIKFNSEAALTVDLQETSSSIFTNTLDGEEREITVTYTVPDYAETQIKKRIVLDLIPKEYGEAEAKINFTSGTELAGLPDTVTYDLGVRYTQNLKYEENAQGGYTVYKGEATDENVIIPYRIDCKYITEIGEYAFEFYSGLTSITIPDSVTSIDSYAFRGCNSLTSITIPDSVTGIGYSAFENCNSLQYNEYNNDLYLGNENNKYFALISATSSSEINSNTKLISDNVFSGHSGLKNITIPDSVTSIGDSAFFGCNSLTDITIPNSVRSIGDHVFQGCGNLTSVTIGNSVTSIGDSAFCDCSSLTSIIIPNSVTSIGDQAFYYCSNLTNITIPDSVKNIGGYAFGYCSNLKYNEYENALYLGNENNKYVAFIEAKSRHITTCDINLNTKVISGAAFQNYNSLTSITIPDGVRSIGGYTFSNCYNLNSITIPDSVRSIGEDAFHKCISLTSITIPNSVTSISTYAFEGCSNLTDITFKGTIAQWEAISKRSTWNKGMGHYTVHCSDGDLSQYESMESGN